MNQTLDERAGLLQYAAALRKYPHTDGMYCPMTNDAEDARKFFIDAFPCDYPTGKDAIEVAESLALEGTWAMTDVVLFVALQ